VTQPRLRAVIAGLAVAGLGIASYLTYARYSGSPISCATGGCETVQQSSYSEVIGIPVAVLGLAGYAAILGTVLLSSPAAAAAGATLSAAGTAFAAYLLYAQLVVIEAVCVWCLANDAVITLAAVACAVRLLGSGNSPTVVSDRP
jgi:uncharacterized membrane protein